MPKLPIEQPSASELTNLQRMIQDIEDKTGISSSELQKIVNEPIEPKPLSKAEMEYIAQMFPENKELQSEVEKMSNDSTAFSQALDWAKSWIWDNKEIQTESRRSLKGQSQSRREPPEITTTTTPLQISSAARSTSTATTTSSSTSASSASSSVLTATSTFGQSTTSPAEIIDTIPPQVESQQGAGSNNNAQIIAPTILGTVAVAAIVAIAYRLATSARGIGPVGMTPRTVINGAAANPTVNNQHESEI